MIRGTGFPCFGLDMGRDEVADNPSFFLYSDDGGLTPGTHEKDLENAPFVAYRAAGGTMSKDEFAKAIVFDLEIAGRIYQQIVQGNGQPKKEKSN